MVWHDCKTDPPKKDGWYILTIRSYIGIVWVRAFYDTNWELWMDDFDEAYEEPIKWAEVDLSEVD